MAAQFRSLGACVLALSLVLPAGCGNDAADTPGSPTAPTSSTPPPSGVPAIAGAWTGTSDFEGAGNTHLITTLTLTVTQNDRNVEGAIRFTGSDWESWRGTFSGTLSGTVDPEFLGTIRLQSEPATGSGQCVGQMTMAGRTTSRTMRWDAATLTMSPTVASQAPACVGTVRNIAWILSKS
jgi:hypothetical protein